MVPSPVVPEDQSQVGSNPFVHEGLSQEAPNPEIQDSLNQKVLNLTQLVLNPVVPEIFCLLESTPKPLTSPDMSALKEPVTAQPYQSLTSPVMSKLGIQINMATSSETVPDLAMKAIPEHLTLPVIAMEATSEQLTSAVVPTET